MFAILYLVEGEIVKTLPGYSHPYLFKTKQEAKQAIKSNRVCVISGMSDKIFKQTGFTSFLNSNPLTSTAKDVIPKYLLEIVEV